MTTGNELPETIGRYRVVNLIGQGGMGKVYQAQDPHLSREVVLKMISLPGTMLEEGRQRFKREVQAAGQLNHPHIVTIYDVDLEHQPAYVVMELLTGPTLRERLKMAPLPWQEALTLLRPLLQALAYAHRMGVIHRDVKPANIMFGGTDNHTLKLVDFGLARWQSGDQMTQAGSIIGTPAYMSPEQARGDVVDARTDIFAAGVILFEAIVGHNPLSKGSVLSTLQETTSHRELDVSPLFHKSMPQGVIHLIKKTVAKNRDQRYGTCDQILADLKACLQPSPTESSTLLSISSVSTRTSANGPDIRVAADIDLSSEIRDVLRRMFTNFEKLAVEAEFGGGFGGSRVFRVRPVESEGHIHLPAVVKIAPIGVIRQECEAYQNWVARTLPKVARLEDQPLLPIDGAWGGLRYALAGSGAFEIQSLRDYYQTATLEDLHWVLEERLFKSMQSWWLHNRADQTFQMQSDYDLLLPPNVLFKAVDHPVGEAAVVIDAHDFDVPDVKTGDQIEVRGFLIDKVEPDEGEVTLNLPPDLSGQRSDSYRVRLVEVTDFESYQPGHIIDSIRGNLTATRREVLTELANEAMGEAIDLSAEPLYWSDPSLPPLPNPLARCQQILRAFQTVKISKIHGDLNMANILVDPATRDVELIDFATVRRGHALHDLLRLETEVVIMLMPAVFAQAGLPAEALCPLYEQLHQITLAPERNITTDLPAASLKKPFELLRTIRKMARTCLFNLNDWGEYYQGLTLYLLGALKFGSLKASPVAPLPQQLAFLGAATAQYLLDMPPHSGATPSLLTVSFPSSTVEPTPAEPVSSTELEPPYGTMHPDSTLYIERAVDEACLEQLKKSYAVTLFIQAPRQMGKSSLMRRAIALTHRHEDKQTVFVDFQKIPEQYLADEENLLVELCLMIGDALRLPEEVDNYWQGRRTNIMKCTRYITEYIIPQLNGPLVLAMDEVERMLTSPFRANFFGMLRTWHNDRAFDENLAQLSLFLSSSTEPYLFVDNPHQSPFNVAEIFSLEDFTRAEVADLNQRHNAPLDEAGVEVLLDLVGGHPFLTRLALYLLATDRIADLETLRSQATADNGPFGDHLRHYLLRVLQHEELKQALTHICRDQTYEENQIFHRLKGAGLVKRIGRKVALRNNLYDRYFKEHLNV